MLTETIAHYRVLSQVGGSGTDAVYAAEDLHGDRRVALKFLAPALDLTPPRLATIQRDVRTLAALHHPSICTVYEIGESDGRHFVAAELLEGDTLRRKLTGQPFEIDPLLELAIQVAEGLDAAHQAGIVHRDLRPGNIFITRQNQAKILDFGLTQAGRESKSSLEETTRGTNPTASHGTRESKASAASKVAYISPEQARGKPLDARSDLFSLGAVLYEMATGTVPFRGDTPALVFDALFNRAPVAATRLNPQVPVKLQTILSRLLEKDPGARYQTAREVAADLRRVRRADQADAHPRTTPVLSTRPARLPKEPGRVGKYVSAIALLAVVAAGGAFLYMKRQRALTEKDAILLTDFVNTTADPVWDVTLKKAVAVDLEQSPYLNVFPEAKARQTLRFMGRASDDRINMEIGREICRRAGIKAMLAGTIATLGRRYVLTLEALNASTGDVLARAEGQAETKDDVLNALHKADSQLRNKLGESLASVERYDKKLSEATTSSLEALEAFTMGDMKHAGGDEIGALPEYQRAVKLDPNFATAYARLGTVYNNLGQSTLSEENRKHAFELRDRASEREKLYIMSHYYADSGQFEKGITALELYEQTYPRDSIPANNLSNIYNQLGQFANALDKARKAVELEPDSISGYVNLAIAYAGLNRMEEAKATAMAGLKRSPNNGALHSILAGIAWNQNDAAGMERELTAAESGGPDGQLLALHMRAALAAGHGQFRQMRALIGKIQNAANQNKLQEAVAGADAQCAVWEALAGFDPLARQASNHALRGDPPTYVTLNAAISLALIRQDDRALKIANDAALGRPFDTLVQFVTIPTVKAIVAMNHAQPAKSIDLLDGAMVYARANSGVLYARGMAYLQEKKGAEAAQEFQRAIDTRSVTFDPVTSLAKLGLARAYSLQSDKANSRMAYQDFLALWKDADPDVPMLKQAKAEYQTVR
jgi:tetratricopeptide (TPR) repeat protein/tRNA A-37 threonylcarbamoyl transferase component Bud32